MRQAVMVGDAIVSAKQQGDSLILPGCQIGTCIGKVQHNQIIGTSLKVSTKWWQLFKEPTIDKCRLFKQQ